MLIQTHSPPSLDCKAPSSLVSQDGAQPNSLLSVSQSGGSNSVIGKMEPSDRGAQDKVSLPKLIRLRSAPTGRHPHTITAVISLSEKEKLLDGCNEVPELSLVLTHSWRRHTYSSTM